MGKRERVGKLEAGATAEFRCPKCRTWAIHMTEKSNVLESTHA
jgi:hypothetical protein